ncbi:McrBC 5-methylcytosine restriction system component-like protein [Halorhabdus utahensis DSM 12940]|uniref:McrBC 5-methylcytosine restriction system component-like protein n=1 Tax=Halorhabdus utahensis (strain DSM 12940 / JCM 11049 / AX-2) TaxID=519442 RepID=C7NQX2_HALUD|nr:McrBC 5-methylcytosine restriction system component-like protein [Halorhabdus utahensis]ACV11876.1 McrBC 5-methylcytosine restriction system component-like protein [Halorhabdus utahensis DSM 12940]
MSLSFNRNQEEFEADIQLGEYESSEPIELSEMAVSMLENEVNSGEEKEGDRIKLHYNRDGEAILTSTQYVGVVSLRDGPTIEVRPKAAGTNLLYLLQYAHDTTATTFESQAPYQAGHTFLDAFGALYEAELRRIVDRGLYTDYRRTDATESHLRGRLDIHRQLQRQPPVPTAFECTYDELTHDILANRAILHATTVLLGAVSDRSITQSLRQHQQLLRRQVSLTPVTIQDIERIELNRLADHYEDILRLTKLVIRNSFVSELQAGSSAAFAMLVNMNTIFENAVERACKEVLSEREDWEVKFQDTSQNLITGGKHTVTLQPDITIYDPENTVSLVADAKWKNERPKNADFYQMTSYMLANNVPGILFYPDCGGLNESRSTVTGGFPLWLSELPTAVQVNSYEDFVSAFESETADAIFGMVD